MATANDKNKGDARWQIADPGPKVIGIHYTDMHMYAACALKIKPCQGLHFVLLLWSYTIISLKHNNHKEHEAN